MTKASDLIEKIEKETGCRVDDPNNPAAIATLIGNLARQMGKSSFDEKDDFAVGMYILTDAERQREQDTLALYLELFGIS